MSRDIELSLIQRIASRIFTDIFTEWPDITSSYKRKFYDSRHVNQEVVPAPLLVEDK